MMLAQAAGYIFLDFYTPKLSLSLSLSASPPHPCAHTHHVPNLAPGPMLRALLSWSAVIINPTAAIRHCSISLQTQRCLITRICRLINADTTCETELLRLTLQLFEYLTLSGRIHCSFPGVGLRSWVTEWPWAWEMGDDMRLIIMS